MDQPEAWKMIRRLAALEEARREHPERRLALANPGSLPARYRQ